MNKKSYFILYSLDDRDISKCGNFIAAMYETHPRNKEVVVALVSREEQEDSQLKQRKRHLVDYLNNSNSQIHNDAAADLSIDIKVFESIKQILEIVENESLIDISALPKEAVMDLVNKVTRSKIEVTALSFKEKGVFSLKPGTYEYIDFFQKTDIKKLRKSYKRMEQSFFIAGALVLLFLFVFFLDFFEVFEIPDKYINFTGAAVGIVGTIVGFFAVATSE